MSPVSHRLAATLAVAATGITTLLVGGLAPAASAAPGAAPSAHASSAASDWFVDPRSKAERRAAIGVPARPKDYTGPVTETRAVYRTSAGDLAVPLRLAVGHTVEQGQALTLDGNGLFVVNTTVLTDSAKAQLARLATSLVDASSIRCEGYADYAGKKEHNRNLARERAARVCDTLAALSPGLKATSTGFGPDRPAVVGGRSEDRRLNRRVTVEMTGTRPAVTLPPVTPPVVVPPVVVPPVEVPPVVVPAFQVPGAPVLDTATAYHGFVYYTFTKPESDGGSPVTGYQVTTDGATWTTVDPSPPNRSAGIAYDGLQGFIYDVTAGVPVELRVRAVNAVGAGAPSNSLSATPYGAPGAPTDLTATVDGSTVELGFVPPTATGGLSLSGYQVRVDAGTWTDVVTSGTSPLTVVLTGQAVGTHEYAVRAVNSYGHSPAASLSGVEVAVPRTPSFSHGWSTGGGGYWLYWNDNNLDPATITGWELSVSGGAWIAINVSGSSADPSGWTQYSGQATDPGCATTGGSCPWNTTGRVRAVTTTGHSEPSNSSWIYWD